jgi:phenylpyruvate tautomerase PptA (4-oxalocrotonate tautomerase family)
VLATPKKDITQALGRVFRKKHDIKVVIVDIVDEILYGMGKRRLATIQKETNHQCTIRNERE